MVGLGADVLGGDEPDDHNAAWTQHQVDVRRGRSVTELLGEWAEVAPGLVALMRDNGSRPLNDVVIHEQDLRSALGRPGARDTDGLQIVRDRRAEKFAEAVADLPVIALRGTTWEWSSGPGDPAVVVSATDFDLFRALTTRRTADQLRGWTTTGDVTPYLDAFAGLGPLPETALPE